MRPGKITWRRWIRRLWIGEESEIPGRLPESEPDFGNQAGFSSPEAAALSGYNGSEGAHVLRIDVINENRVDVIMDTEPSHPMTIHCDREGDLWYEAGEISGD
jgi:hypothetical protein